MTRDNRRTQKRISNRLPIYFGPDEPKYLGFTRNISLRGMEIASETIFYPNSVLNLAIETENEPIRAKGVVRWFSEAKHLVKSNLKQSMGVNLIERPEAYVDLLLVKLEEFSEQRREPRFEKVFKVIFESPADLMEEYTQDISCEGIFVLTEIPPKVNTFVSLQLVIPETMEMIHAEGEVVHVITKEMATELGLNPGIGVHFTQFYDNGREELDQYIAEMKARLHPEEQS